MLFNSISFAVFLPIVFFLYWFVFRKRKAQNLLLMVASYFFYACWDYRFLFLLIFSTFLDYFTGIRMSESENSRARRFWLWLSISINLGFLGFFKYYNFFTESFANAISNFGWDIDPWTLKVILPVGISFYTFHGLSYVLDIYNKKIKPERNFIDYSLFVSFFPLLVAGPIERATHLLPQILKKRRFSFAKATDGCRQILWGLFKKIVIADQCANYADVIFSNSAGYSGSTLVMGALFFTVQIYCDFSGYSDIAIGTARLFGIDLLRNFSYPYFSRDIAEFWRRWHISLSSWFRDYLYIPLGGSRGGNWAKIRNTFIIFIVSGFWHGANWTFIIWGALNAVYFLPLMLLKRNRKNIDIVAQGRSLPSFRELMGMTTTFILAVFGWIFFRARDVEHAFHYIRSIFSQSILSIPQYPDFLKSLVTILITIGFFLIEWYGREDQHALARLGVKWQRPIRWGLYYGLIIMVFIYSGNPQTFIYFQF